MGRTLEQIPVGRDASRGGVRTRELLLEACGEEFAEKGFHGTTVREIAARGGTNIAAVSYHFQGKESLFREAVAVAAARFRVTIQDALCDAPQRERIGRLFTILFVPEPDAQSLPWAHRLMLRELLRPDLRCADTIGEFRGFLADIIDTPSIRETGPLRPSGEGDMAVITGDEAKELSPRPFQVT